MTAFPHQGFTILLWADTTSPRLQGLEATDYEREEKALVQDAVCLLGCRWGLEFSYTSESGVLYAFGICNRFNIGLSTITRALGLLSSHIVFQKAGVHETAEQLIRFKLCKERWQVPEVVTEGSYGEGQQEQASGPSWRKRK